MEFYDIALAKLLQTLPELSSYIVTFKDATEELQNETGIKVGIFILRAGQEYMYVPVVSKSDNVYPIDSIFFSSNSKFFPLTKKTLRMIESHAQLGQGNPTKIPKNVAVNPDLTQLITPPRTGKFVYASASRLGGFLDSMPNSLKVFAMEKFAAEQSMYESLHKLFNLKEIFDHLKPAPGAMAAVTNAAPISILTSVSQRLSDADIKQVLDKGYVVSGSQQGTRVAVSHQNFNESGTFRQVSESDGNKDYELMLKNGNSREAFIPKSVIPSTPRKIKDSFALFTNGDFAYGESFISVGDVKDRKSVLTSLFDYNPPMLPKDIENGDNFAIISTDAELIGVFRAHNVTLNNLGVEIRASSVGKYHSTTIHCYRNFGSAFKYDGSELYVPYNSLVLRLGKDLSSELELSVNSASRKREINGSTSLLGDQINLGFDGVEFVVNGVPMAKEASVMERLVIQEQIDPDLAASFVKQARETSFTRIYLSKSAADAGNAAPAEIPQYGNVAGDQGQVGLNGSFVKNTQSALQTNDAQAVETTIISELLQAPDMFELIEEYLPDIEECIDRLGRILLLSRVHIDKLADSNDADNVFAFLASLKAVYRMLGDNFTKLQEMITVKPDATSGIKQ